MPRQTLKDVHWALLPAAVVIYMLANALAVCVTTLWVRIQARGG